MDSVLKRLSEPSTYAGISAMLGLAGVHLAPEAYQGILSVLGVLGSVLAIVLPEANK